MADCDKVIRFIDGYVLHYDAFDHDMRVLGATKTGWDRLAIRFRMSHPPSLLQDHHIDSGAAPAHQHAHIVFAAVQLQVNFLFSKPQARDLEQVDRPR